MARRAVHGRSREPSVHVTLHALRTGVCASEGKARARVVVECRPGPTNCTVALRTLAREVSRHMVGIASCVVVSRVA